jgi:hypothetical protein
MKKLTLASYCIVSTVIILSLSYPHEVILLAHSHSFEDKPVYMTTKLGPQLCESLPLTHSLTRCDTVSYMYNIGKPSVIKTLNPGMLQGTAQFPSLDPGSEAPIESFVCKLSCMERKHFTKLMNYVKRCCSVPLSLS